MAVASNAISFPLSLAPASELAPARGLLVTGDRSFARAFRRALKQAGHIVWLDIYPSLGDAVERDPTHYDWIALDLDVAAAPGEAVETARRSWPGVLVALVSHWWSEREDAARAHADYIIHKPVRASELQALFDPGPARRLAPTSTPPLYSKN
jgi:DNA-binding response OmpR family regulator